MKLLSKFFLGVLLLTVASVGWAACPQGQKQTYKGCEVIPGWPPADEHRIFSQLPCLFNGAQALTSPNRAVNRSTRCCPNCKGYTRSGGKKGLSLISPRGTPVFAIADMRLKQAKNKNALRRDHYCCVDGKIFYDAYVRTPFDDLELVFEDKSGNEIGYYHMLSTPFVPGFNKGKCMRPVCFQGEKWKRDPYMCGEYSEELLKSNWWVKKGDLIGLSGTTGRESRGDPHISLWVQMKDASGIYQYWAPEDTFEWENLPRESDAYLFPFMHQDYIASLSEADQAWIKQEREWMETSESEVIAAKTMSCDDTTP